VHEGGEVECSDKGLLQVDEDNLHRLAQSQASQQSNRNMPHKKLGQEKLTNQSFNQLGYWVICKP
jgi:hypothetical protein